MGRQILAHHFEFAIRYKVILMYDLVGKKKNYIGNV